MNKFKYSILLLICAFNFQLNAQILPPPPPPPSVPVDGGILLLLLSGLIYGIKKIRK